ncbi:MAG TPA: SPOR domain-containing protein, partial [Blastocatellia bacterium]|nr:SPOR domain-containing protein [Blastocatellia bacterium]
FWAGLYVVKQDAPATTNQGVIANQNAQGEQVGKQATANAGAQPREQPPGDNARYVVFVAAYGTLDKAKQLESELRKKYLAAHVQMPGGQDGIYRVNIGPYDKRDADKVAGELSNERKGIMILPWTQN